MIAFLAVAIVVIVAPGPDFALVVRNSVTRARGTATACGVVVAQLVWVLATAAGLAAILIASRPAFEALRLMGAAYLVWLGLSMLLRRTHAHRMPRPGSPFRQGILSNLGNPKMPVFFTSLLPQFGASFAALASHGLMFAALTLAWLSLVARAGALLRVPAVRRALDVATGIVLVAFGVRLATERR
ncbi:MAG TPA: LysE family translocator [Gaiellaceae bacterium]|jgi:threonine/homoserine/homoserine lactone efflux protein|nr:LysE family translocator [Gaiellaceae bacterium]